MRKGKQAEDGGGQIKLGRLEGRKERRKDEKGRGYGGFQGRGNTGGRENEMPLEALMAPSLVVVHVFIVISYCCFDMQLVSVLREVKYLNFQQQKEIPESAGGLFSQNETFRKFVDNLDLIVGWYNKVCVRPC